MKQADLALLVELHLLRERLLLLLVPAGRNAFAGWDLGLQDSGFRVRGFGSRISKPSP